VIASATVRRPVGILTWWTVFAATLRPLRPLWAQEPAAPNGPFSDRVRAATAP
jgi:hypothetical protein